MKKELIIKVTAGIFIGLAIQGAFNSTIFRELDETDDLINMKRSGLVIVTDHHTGCEYLRGGHGLTPRRGRGGSQSGCRSDLMNRLYDIDVKLKSLKESEGHTDKTKLSPNEELLIDDARWKVKMTFRTSFEMEIDVEFHNEEGAAAVFVGGDWGETFYKFDQLEEVAEHLSNCFHGTSDYWDGKRKKFIKFIEGFGDFIQQEGGSYKFIDESNTCGDITISHEMELESSYTFEVKQ